MKLFTHNLKNEDIKDILSESVFYPSSGVDATPIEAFGRKYSYYIHADYEMKEQYVHISMQGDFSGVGYDMLRHEEISESAIIRSSDTMPIFEMNKKEKSRYRELSRYHRRRFVGKYLPYFSRWGVYRFNPLKSGHHPSKPDGFSLLHIGGDAIIWFKKLYLSYGVNPKSVSIINPGILYVDNYTTYLNTEDTLYKMILHNVNTNGAEMPETIITDCLRSTDKFPWPYYEYEKTSYHWSGVGPVRHVIHFKKLPKC